MILHTPTLLLATALIGVTVSVLYLVEISRHGRLGSVDRCWVITFMVAILATLSYATAGLAPAFWLGEGVGDAGLVLTLGSLWSGARAFDGRPPRLWVPGAVAVVLIAIVAAAGPGAGPWSAVWVYLPALIVFASLSGWTILRGGLRSYPGATSVAMVCLVAAAFHAVRLVVALAFGVDALELTGFLGDEASTVLHMILLVVGAFGVMTIRSGDAVPSLVATFTFDPYLGTRTAESFRERASEILAARTRPGGEIALVLVEVVDLDAVGAAYGAQTVERVLERVARTTSEVAPQGGIVGAHEARDRFVVLLPGSDRHDAERWASELRHRLRETPLVVDGDPLHVTIHTGVADHGPGFPEMMAAAAASLRRTCAIATDAIAPHEGAEGVQSVDGD